jgi:Bacterial regulatory helix-turn-helix protein, lysR family
MSVQRLRSSILEHMRAKESRMLDSRLRHLVAVARPGCFTAGAAAGGITQSAATKSGADLEREIGYELVTSGRWRRTNGSRCRSVQWFRAASSRMRWRMIFIGTARSGTSGTGLVREDRLPETARAKANSQSTRPHPTEPLLVRTRQNTKHLIALALRSNS